MASVFLKRRNFATKWYIHFVIRLNQPSEIKIYADEKTDFSERVKFNIIIFPFNNI